ncbi:MAG: indolepyruvate ferredoxin oxidoreductase subunit alpha [Raoultibacter sp.]|jgi:indolepyruvate ferredoxin oxidoreductase alpha subunit
MNQLLMGNEAFAHAALAAGVRVVAGYPGTPSSEVIETIAAERAAGRAQGVHVEWSTNEKAALEVAAAASVAGARSLFTCKQVGLNVASDALMSLNYIGVKGGLVLFVADDPGPISSQTEQDTRRFASFAKVPVLDPSTPEQGYDMILAAFELSECYKTPVIVRSSTRVCHASSFAEVPTHTSPRTFDGFTRDSRWVIFPRRAYQAHGEINERLKAIAADYSQVPQLAAFNDSFEKNNSNTSPKVGILTGGVSAAYTQEALRSIEAACAKNGIAMPAYRFLQVGTPYPFPSQAFEQFAAGLTTVAVFEELDHVLEDEALRYAGQHHSSFEVEGMLSGCSRDRGENTVDDIQERLTKLFQSLGLLDDVLAIEGEGCATSATSCEAPPIPVRPPVLCAGCPHRGSFYAIKRALKNMKQEAIYAGDIGCYTLGNAQPLDMVDSCLCMGAGITMAQGFSIVEPAKKCVAFVGDSTFFASGLTGIVNALYNQHDICIAVLDNSTTAMTGAQPHPGTGQTLMGTQSKPISIEAVLQAFGVETIESAYPFDLNKSVEAATRALTASGPSAIIFKAPCISLVPPLSPVKVLTDACTGCKLCITEIGCPAIGFSASENQAIVDTSLCTGCGLCVSVCSFDAIAEEVQADA